MNYKIMEDLKSSENCNLKTTSPSGTASQLTVEKEIVLDLTGSKMACVQKHVSTFNNKLPQKNSGYEKKALNISRTKPQMLGNLTFREIAEKRKEMLKISSVEHTENDVPNLTSLPATESSLKRDERDEDKCLEKATFINPHMLVGKTITLEQGGIRRIKFLSQDSNTSSNKKLLKLDALQLTPKIIVRKSKQGFLPSSQTQRYCKDLSKINHRQKMSEHVDINSDRNVFELCVQPRFKSLPYIHSEAHGHLSSRTEFEEKDLSGTTSGLLTQTFSNKKDVYNYSNENLVDIQKEKEENVAKCTLLNSSHDNLTILSQVACGELEIKNQLKSKEVTKNTHSVKEKVQDSRHNLKKPNYVSLDHSYQQKHQPSKGIHCYEHSANVRPMKTKPSISKRVENISQPSSQISKRHFEEKPMFAWCTQYITHRKLININSVAKKYELPSNQEQKFHVGNKTLPKSLNSYDNSKSQHNLQKRGHPFKSNEIGKTSNQSLFLRTPQGKEIFKGTIPPKSHLCCENEDRKDSLVETAEISVETFISSKEKLSEVNDEIVILKEILVTKSPSCNAFPSKDSYISKLKNNNKRNLCATNSQRRTLGMSKTLLGRKIATNIPKNEEQKSKLFHKSNGDHNVIKPCTEVSNNSSQTSSKGITGSEKVHEIKNVRHLPLKTVKSQPTFVVIKPEEYNNYTRECNSVSTEENITTDLVIGKTTSYPIKKCFVLVERLNEPSSLVGEVSIKSSSTSSTNANEICCDCVSSNNHPETNGGQSEVCVLHNSESKFRDKGSFKNNNSSNRHQVLTTSSAKNVMVSEVNKVEIGAIKPSPIPFIKKSKTTNNSKTKKINVFKENISASKELLMPVESHIDNNHNLSGISTNKSLQEECDGNNSVACQGNYDNFEIELHCKEIVTDPENIIGDKYHIALGNNVNNLCKRKLKVSTEGSESFTPTKKVKLPCQRSKKLYTKNIKTTLKKGNKPKTKPVDVKVKTEDKKQINNITKSKEISIISNQKKVPISNMNGKIAKHSPEKTFSGNREIYYLLTDFKTLGCSIEPVRKLRRRSANNSQKSVENIESLNGCVGEEFSKVEDPISCNQVTKNSAEMKSNAYSSFNEATVIENNNKSLSKSITPLKPNNFQYNLEASLDTADTVLVYPSCTKPTPKSVKNLTPVNQCYSDRFISNQKTTKQDDVQDLQIDFNLFPPMQQNILKCNKPHSDHNSSQSCNNGKSPDINFCSQNRSSRPKRLKQLQDKNILIPRNLKKEKTGVRELKRRKCLPLNVGITKQKSLEFSWSNTEKIQENVKIKKVKTKSNKHTLEKCSSTVNNLIKLPSNSGKKNGAARNRLKNKLSDLNMRIKRVISTFTDHTASENIPTSKSIQELEGNFEGSIQQNDQRHSKKLGCEIHNQKTGSRLSAKAKRLQRSRQMRQHSQALSRSCLSNSKQKYFDSTDVALHIQTNNLKYAKRDFVDHGLLLANSNQPSLEFPSVTNCLVSSIGVENKQSMSGRRRPILNSQSLENKNSKSCTEEKKSVLSKAKSNPLSSNNRKLYQKVTKAQYIPNNQVNSSDLSESNDILNKTVISCVRLNKPTLNKPTSVKTSPTSILQPNTECPRKKSLNHNLSTASSINIQPTYSQSHINRQDDKLTIKVKCSSSTSNSRQEKVEPTNDLIPNPSSVRDKIRLLIMEQLKRSRRGSKIALEKAPPKR